jgi:glycosyltransferase involved in cell wall biosynthesis
VNKQPTILILGKLPPPFIGPAIATEIILNSSLKDQFNLIHFDTRINKNVATMGRFSLAKSFKMLSLYRNFRKLVKATKPDLILIPISQTTMGFYKDARFIKIGAKYSKVVVQLRGSNFKNWLASAGSSVNKRVAFALSKCAGVIVLGNKLKHLFEYHFPADRIFVVPNGANYELQKRQSNELTILYLANFLPSKSFDDVLKAVGILKEKGITNFKLNAAGAWDNEDFKKTCEDIIKQQQLEHVNLMSPQAGKNKMQLFADADVFVFCPKMPEGHPWVIVEAMANGLPIIATDQGAIVESVLEEKNGFIVPSESPEVIADKLEQLIINESLRQQMSDQSSSHYANNFTEEKMVENLVRAFNTILKH